LNRALVFRLPAYFCDIVILVLVSFIVFVLISGGGFFAISSGLRIRAHTISNPLLGLYLLLVIRFGLAKRIPFLGRNVMDISRLSDRAALFWRKITIWFQDLEPLKARRIVLAIIGLSVLIKVLNAWFHFGFFSGDDVEIHELAFSQIFHWDWKAWSLRSPFFPMVFIYPIQFILHSAGVHDPGVLIFAGRLVVIAFSALSLWLTYKLASRIFSSVPIGLLSLVFLAMSKLHTSFASTELPRPVASFFVLLSCWFLVSEKNLYRNGAFSAVSLAVAAALRFSEVIFIVPAILFLALSRRRRQALVLGVIFTVILLIILGLGDMLYWKSPWYSLKNVVDYTLVKRLSSRGYESPFYYLLSVGIWSDFLTIGLACFALRLRNRGISLWAFSPLIILSFLPHKEPRYLVPTIPFIAIMAGLSAWHFLEKNRGADFTIYLPQRLRRPFFALSLFVFGTVLLSSKDYRFAYVSVPFLVLLVALYSWMKHGLHRGGADQVPRVSPVRLGLLLILTVLAMGTLEIDGFRLRRTESGVEMARFLARRADLRSVAIEDAWKAGGRLYLWRYQTIMNIDETRLRHPEQLIREVETRNIQALGLTEEHIRGLQYDDLLRSHGYHEVSFAKKKRRPQYRLFLRE
jgi:hypothetical protein